jgi:2-polyprenyl-6-methoxyphenol hydroxylase-like FAD-dependent oxidoreductase
VEELTGTSTGYIVPHWETVVRQRFDLRAKFLLGADGYHSLVRQRLGLETIGTTERELFGAYEFLTSDEPHDEVRVVLDSGSTSVLWPLPGNKCRWNFQLLHSDMPDFPEKERRALRLSDESTDEKIRVFVEGLARKRAPWFKLSIKEVTWCSEVAFEHRCVKEFGVGRCWLAGDAAHQGGPVGVQSMNAGFTEAKTLAGTFEKAMQAQGGEELLLAFSRAQLARWQQLLGLTGGLKAGPTTNPWIKERAPRMLAHLPATDSSLERLAAQLRLELA